MRVSQQLTTTLREAPRDSEGGNAELLTRAGFVRQLTAGVYSFLPLGNRVIQKISRIVPLSEVVSVIQEEIQRFQQPQLN